MRAHGAAFEEESFCRGHSESPPTMGCVASRRAQQHNGQGAPVFPTDDIILFPRRKARKIGSKAKGSADRLNPKSEMLQPGPHASPDAVSPENR
jgi:hypothetical protein